VQTKTGGNKLLPELLVGTRSFQVTGVTTRKNRGRGPHERVLDAARERRETPTGNFPEKGKKGKKKPPSLVPRKERENRPREKGVRKRHPPKKKRL